jgi:pyocin large subunit-like protein
MNAHEWCVKHSTSTGKSRAVLLVLAEEAGNDDYIRSSVPALCAMIGLKWTNGQQVVKALVRSGRLAEHESDHVAPYYTFPAYEEWRRVNQ